MDLYPAGIDTHGLVILEILLWYVGGRIVLVEAVGFHVTIAISAVLMIALFSAFTLNIENLAS
jgi:hypothetical protein